MGLLVELHTGEHIDLDDLGIYEEERLVIGSPEFEGDLIAVGGMHGYIPGEVHFRGRPITGNMVMLAEELDDMPRKRSELFWLFDARRTFWLSEKRDPAKRWLVKTVSPYSLDEIATIGRFQLDMTALLPFAQSRLIVERSFTVPRFRYRNEGTEVIDMANPHMEETEIRFTGASDRLTIINHSNGKRWAYKGQTDADDVILIKGARSLKNGQSIFGETNLDVLTFDPGFNDIEIVGTTGDFSIEIRSRYFYQ